MARTFVRGSTYGDSGSITLPGSGVFTYSAWVYRTANSGLWYAIMGTQGTGKLHFYTRTSATDALCTWSTGTGLMSFTGLQVGLNAWHHCACTRNSSNTMTGFLDGSSSAASTDSTSVDNGTVSIGSDVASSSSQGHDGDLAEIAIWNAELNSDEINALAAGVVPFLIRNSSLQFYSPIWGATTTDHDFGSAHSTVTWSGSPAKADHAPVAVLGRSTYFIFDSATTLNPFPFVQQTWFG